MPYSLAALSSGSNHGLDNLHGMLVNSQQAIPELSNTSMSLIGGSDDQTAQEIIFEAQSQLDKQQKEEHGGVVRGSDAAKVQVLFHPALSPPPSTPPHPTTAVLLSMWCCCTMALVSTLAACTVWQSRLC